MAVIIGNATRVSINFLGGGTITDIQGITSVDWTVGGQPNKQWALGSTDPYSAIIPAQSSLSFSVYGDVTSSIDIDMGTITAGQCPESPAKGNITIVPSICSKAAMTTTFTSEFYVSSYSYTKDRTTQGTETWQCNAYKEATLPTTGGTAKIYAEPIPTYVALGSAEGTLTGEPDVDLEAITGTVLATKSITITGQKGNVQASQLSIGEYESTQYGTFSAIGGGVFWAPGVKAAASVTLSLQPIYLEP